jgi:hypothetical protein
MTITWAQILNVEGQLRENRSRLDNLSLFMRRSQAFARDYGRQVMAAEQKQGEAVAKYQYFRVLVGLPRATGLEGLGVAIAPIIAGAVAAAQFAALVLLAAAVYKLTSELIAVAQTYLGTRQLEAKTKQELSTASQQAYVRGDVEEGRRLAILASQTSAAGVLETFSGSLPWIAGIVALAIIGPRLMDAISD